MCRNGFTLIEVLITAALVGVLATIAVTQFSHHRQKGYNSNAVSDLGSSKTILEAYFAENRSYP